MRIEILRKSHLSPSVKEQIARLFQQLSQHKRQRPLEEVLGQENPITLAYCTDDKDGILGIASIAIYTVISGKKGWIEDVVVAEDSRGKGIGKMLMNKLLELGKEKGLSEILLFTEDHRSEAIKLYSKLGFKPKDSQIYSLRLT